MQELRRLIVVACFVLISAAANAQSSPNQMSSVDTTIAQYCAAWATTDSQTRESLLANVWAENAEYVDPQPVRVAGRSALNKEMLRFQKENPGSTFRCNVAQSHHDFVRYSWVMIGPDGVERFRGMDFGELDQTGRFVRIVSFFGDAPGPK